MKYMIFQGGKCRHPAPWHLSTCSAPTAPTAPTAPIQHLRHLFSTYSCSYYEHLQHLQHLSSIFRAFSELCGKIWCVGAAITLAVPPHQILSQSSEKALKMLDRC